MQRRPRSVLLLCISLLMVVACGGRNDAGQRANSPTAAESPSSSGSASSPYVALPSQLPAPAVLVLHPWWGLSDDVRAVADDLAGAGYVAMAPDLYGDAQTASTIDEAEALASSHSEAVLASRAQMALGDLLDRPDVDGDKAGVIGFSLGGGAAAELATRLAPDQVAALTLYYDARPGLAWDRLQAPVMGHYASDDSYNPEGTLTALRAALDQAGASSTIFTYPSAKHWFAEPSRPEYRPAESALAWDRTLKWLDTILR